MSLYGDYIRERLGDEIVEDETGFATYRFLNEKQVYIVDIYIVPEFRKKGAATALADKVVEAAKQRGCMELIGSVVPQAKGSTDSLRVLLGYGMSLQSAGPDLILFRKEF
jgi:predicted GNAT family acetyltransferase